MRPGALAEGADALLEATHQWRKVVSSPQLTFSASNIFPLLMSPLATAEGVYLQCDAKLLEAIFYTLLQRHDSIPPCSPPPPSLLLSTFFPYRGGEGNLWPLCREPPGTVEVAAAASSSASTKCPIQGCQQRFEVKDLRAHIASHILWQDCGGACGLQQGPEACGFCGSVVTNRLHQA